MFKLVGKSPSFAQSSVADEGDSDMGTMLSKGLRSTFIMTSKHVEKEV